MEVAGFAHLIVGMYMAVNQISGLEPVHQLQKVAEALMDRVVQIAVAPGRGVGQDDVNALGPAELPPDAAITPTHLALGILVGSAVIERTSPEAQDPEAVDADKISVNTIAALRRETVIAAVVIAVDIKQRRMPHCDKKAEVIRLQVSG